MKWNHVMVRSSALLALSTSLLAQSSAIAAEPDFTCMKQSVLAKAMVTQRHQEFDVILENDCPGSVNWSMCIERMDPFNNRVTETLTPSGEIAKDDKFRINLQMKRQEDRQAGLTGYDEFYVNVDYSIDTIPSPNCVARECENEKRAVREKIRSNERARQKAEDSMKRKMASECPKSGWADSQQEKCMTRVQKEAKAELDGYAETDRALQTELAEINPEKCDIHSVE